MSKKGGKCKSRGANCAFEITLSQAIMLTLVLVCAFSPRVHSIPQGPHFNKLFAAKGGRLNLLCKLYFGFRQSYILTLSKLNFDFVKVIFRLIAEVEVNPQLTRRANITATQYHCESNITVEDNLTAKAIFRKGTNSLTSPGFSGILALRVSRTVASQDEESPSITRQGAGEIPVKATSRKVQQRYTARFIV